jgi:SAM-dependent methyltransferase
VPGEFAVRACNHCGLGETVPRLEAGALRPHYTDEYSTHGTKAEGTAGLRKARAQAKLRHGPFAALLRVPPGRALDVGCGTGQLGEWLEARGWDVTGVEPSQHAAGAARARGLTVHAEPFADVVLEPASFDAILFNHSLEHLPDPLATLGKARSFLRSGGLVVATLPNFGSWQRRLFGTYWFHLDLPRHLFHFTHNALRIALERSGLERTDIQTSSTAVGFWGSLQYALAGRCVLHGHRRAAALLAADAAYPLLAASDLVADGDCLDVTAFAS